MTIKNVEALAAQAVKAHRADPSESIAMDVEALDAALADTLIDDADRLRRAAGSVEAFCRAGANRILAHAAHLDRTEELRLTSQRLADILNEPGSDPSLDISSDRESEEVSVPSHSRIHKRGRADVL